MKGSIDAVKKGLPALLSEPDEMGRAILYIDWNLIEAAGQRTGIADVRSIEEVRSSVLTDYDGKN